MNNQTSHNQRASSLGRMVWEFLLSKLVNQHTRRIIFISSLFSRMSYMEKSHFEKLEESAMERLNQLMVLVRDSNSLSFPSRFRDFIWDQTKIGETLRPEVLHASMTESERLRISEELVDMTPKCWRYLSRPEMVKDVYSLLEQFKKLHVAPIGAAA